MTEYWKDIPGYKGHYQVSNLGRIKSIKFDSEKIMKVSDDGRGYLQVCLSKNNKNKLYKIHRLVMLAFIGEPLTSEYYEINHINEVKTDNRLENLQYCTRKYNVNYGNRNKKAGKKISKALIGNQNGIKKPVIGINKINGFICEYPSINEVTKCLEINGSHISACCQGKRKSAGGYKWFYKEEKQND